MKQDFTQIPCRPLFLSLYHINQFIFLSSRHSPLVHSTIHQFIHFFLPSFSFPISAAHFLSLLTHRGARQPASFQSVISFMVKSLSAAQPCILSPFLPHVYRMHHIHARYKVLSDYLLHSIFGINPFPQLFFFCPSLVRPSDQICSRFWPQNKFLPPSFRTPTTDQGIRIEIGIEDNFKISLFLVCQFVHPSARSFIPSFPLSSFSSNQRRSLSLRFHTAAATAKYSCY